MQEENTRTRAQKTLRDHGKNGAVWVARFRFACTEVLWGCGAWIFGQASMLFGTYPLGMALLCGSSKHTLAVLIGLLLTAFSNSRTPLLYGCMYLAAALIRVIAGMILDSSDARFELPERLKKRLRDGTDGLKRRDGHDPLHATTDRLSFGQSMRMLFTDSVRLRMATAAVCMFVIALYRVFEGGFRYYDWFAAVFAVVTATVATAVYSVALDETSPLPLFRDISAGALLFSLVFAARSVTLLHLPLAPILALFFTFYACAVYGSGKGIAASLLCGVAYHPLYAPGVLLAALIYSLFHRMERESLALLSACVGMVGWSVYVSDSLMLLTMVPVSLAAGSAFTAVRKWAKRDRNEVAREASAETGDACRALDRKRYRDSNERFRGISEAFSSLSEVFYNLSDRYRRPGTLDLRKICDDAFHHSCADCPNQAVCWGLEYSESLGTVNELITALHTRGKVSADQVFGALIQRCERMDGILETINRECARVTGELLRNNRTEIFAMDYEAAANIINEALEEDDGEYRCDAELERRMFDYLKDADVIASGVTVYGNRRRRIFIRGADIEQAKVSLETLRSDLGEMCGSELGQPIFEVERNVSNMVLQAKQKLSVTAAQNNVSADGGVSGDSVNLFSNRKDYFYALISDGMGAGKEAALTSNLCSVFMEKMLRAGNRAGTTLRMLNNMIRSRTADSTRECTSTVDLLELDLMTGDASFLKSGAAPSFVVRDTVVRRLQSGTVPIGIFCTPDTQETRFRLREGDTVVMMSDGILQSDADDEWLMSYLSEAGKQTPEEIVYRICFHAAERETHDDCSVIALRVHRAEE